MQNCENIPIYNSIATISSAKVYTGRGVLHSVAQGQNDALPTAGSVTIYDNITNSGKILYTAYWPATAFPPSGVVLDVVFEVGLYIYFNTTVDVNITATYKGL